jgi:hypothetical protein
VDGKAGFDFVGFNIRQYKVGKTKSGKLGRELLGFKALITRWRSILGWDHAEFSSPS